MGRLGLMTDIFIAIISELAARSRMEAAMALRGEMHCR